ncbi:MAG: Ppx/GppA family phosphatase [Rickettsiales bacterium]|nr:Ppx/GppA family phosphatase [Rickettsiales bacterium]
MSEIQSSKYTDNNAAVIDIGSNSVRLVIYNGIGPASISVFNEKITCALADNIESTGVLSTDGVEMADKALARFKMIISMMEVRSLDVFATAAVRDAEDGGTFVEEMNEKHGFDIRVLSGEEEAYYSALGVVSSISDAKGVVGDLGGGSLELTNVTDKKISDKESIALGIVRLHSMGRNKVYINNYIQKNLEGSSVIEKMKGSNFYAVGGGFRTLAKISMYRNAYPLRIVDNYKVSKQDFIDTLDDIEYLTKDQLASITSISSKRCELLPVTAMIAKNIIELGDPENIIFSTCGVREGMIFEQIADEDKKKPPLLESSVEMLRRVGRDPEYAHMLMNWMSPLFEDETEEQALWRHAACILSEYCCYEHTEYRAEIAFRRFVDASIIGASHRGRVFIASCLYYRYKTKHDPALLDQRQTILTAKEVQYARAIGYTMKLANDLTGGLLGIKDNVHLEVTNKKLILFFVPESEALVSDSIRKRMKLLGAILGKTPEIMVGTIRYDSLAS